MALSKGIGHLAWGSGTSLVLAATLLWAVEVVVAKKLLSGIAPATISLVRMGVGSAALLAYLAIEGSLGSLFALDRGQLGWVLFTGLLLAGYVGTWMTALSRARAIDVTSILVASALITAALQALAGTQPLAPEWLGLVLIMAGTALVAWRMPRRHGGDVSDPVADPPRDGAARSAPPGSAAVCALRLPAQRARPVRAGRHPRTSCSRRSMRAPRTWGLPRSRYSLYSRAPGRIWTLIAG